MSFSMRLIAADYEANSTARRAARLVGPLSREGLPARDRGELEVERAVAELGLAHLPQSKVRTYYQLTSNLLTNLLTWA